MSKLKVMTIVGTRPEIIRLSEVIKACDKYFDHILVHTGQNWDYTLNGVFFKELGIRQPDYFLECAGGNIGATIGAIIEKSYNYMQMLKPDALLILGDTNSALCAIPAKRLKIPIFHMEAGNRCFDDNVPEEINRRIVDHIADINLPYTAHSRRYLLAEGIRGESVFVTGSPMREVLGAHEQGIEESLVLETLSLQPKGYFVVSAHREENIDNEANFMALMGALNTVAERYNMPIVYSVHPRSKKWITKRGFAFHPLVKTVQPFGFFEYIKLEKNAFCVLSDSGTLSEESAMLGFPAVLIRTSTERPEALDAGSIVVGGITAPAILESIVLATALYADGGHTAPVGDYTDTNVSLKVVRILQSYTKLVNQRTWNKS